MQKMHEVNQFLKVRSANEHNLKNIDINIPKNKLIVMTGVSGSGKSSLAFDTIYAEGQRYRGELTLLGSRPENQISHDQQNDQIDQSNQVSISDDIASDLDDEIPF